LELENYSFDELELSTLFTTFVNDFEKLAHYYNGNPFKNEEICKRADSFRFHGDRANIVNALTSFNNQFDPPEPVQNNLKRLKDERSLAVVTGQQVNLYGGPLYTVFKTITAIHHARKMEEQLQRPVVPVFWLGDEDHDYDEIKSVAFPRRNNITSFSYESPVKAPYAVSEITFDDTYGDFRNSVFEIMRTTDFTKKLWNMLDDCYKEGATFGQAFGRLMTRLFGQHGLVLAGSHDVELKKYLSDALCTAIQKADQISERLNEQSEKVDDEFHQQVKLYDSNLFYHDAQKGRVKMKYNSGSWSYNEQTWTSDELVDKIREKPEKFSPNVFLRPILQDKLLPTIGYVGGPGEVAYYAQMKKIYEVFDLQMPIIFPRFSGTLIESSIERIMKKLPFEFKDYNQRIEDLESAYVEQAEDVDIEKLFGQWKGEVQQMEDRYSEIIKEIDPTLKKAAGKATAAYYNELDKLKGKVHRATKKQEEIQLNRIRKIREQLFPGDGLQERSISFIYFLNKYGLDLWDQILEQLDDQEHAFHEHKLIYL